MVDALVGIPLVALSDIGRIISLVILGGGLAFFFVRAFLGKEVDRRLIYLFVFIAVAAPLLFPITFSEKASDVVKAVYNKVESLPEGSRVLLSFDFDPAMAPEVQPMANAFTRHCLAKGHKLIFMSLFATGQALLTQSVQEVVAGGFPEKVYGKDYVNIGYKAGNEGVLNVIITDFKKMFPTDIRNIPYDSIEVFDGIRSCKDLDLVLTIGGGKPGVKEWVLFVGDPGKVPVGCGIAAVVAPQMYPYYPKQLLGILGGIKGAAEYESELVRNYEEFKDIDTPGLKMMGPQTLAHMVIIAFILIGNFSFFLARARRGKE